jgi:hypothetical protein
MYRTVALMALLLSIPVGLEAQRERETGFMVHQMSVCPGQNMAEINRLNELTAPILDDLVDEGMIRVWYDVRHAWGDEWNVGMVTVADSHRDWLDCPMHKDNMYAVRDSGDGDG